MTHNHLTVIGRIDGDNEDSILMFEAMTAEQAEEHFRQEMLEEYRENRGEGNPDVYVTYVLSSDTPTHIEKAYT